MNQPSGKSPMNEVGQLYTRPWGSYQTLALEEGYQIKVITVKPGGRLSLQKHTHRSERWVVVKGAPSITVANEVGSYHPGDTVFIPAETVHRLENLTSQEVVVAEVQFGSYLGEDDIIRLEDVYGRDK